MLTNRLRGFTIAAMRISCPHCHAIYEVGPLIKNAVLICHRCQTEFGFGTEPPAAVREGAAAQEPLPLFDNAVSSAARKKIPGPRTLLAEEMQAPTGAETAAAAATHAPATDPMAETAPPDQFPEQLPERRRHRIWPWLTAMLLIIGGAGFWLNQDYWLANPWVRSVLINVGAPLPVRDEDWRIDPASVKGQWLTRQDDSRILLIEGSVENRLYSRLSPPKILVSFFDAPGSNRVVFERTLVITEPPMIQQLRKVPYIPPPRDTLPIEGQSKRDFVLVIEDVPVAAAGDFALAPVASQ